MATNPPQGSLSALPIASLSLSGPSSQQDCANHCEIHVTTVEPGVRLTTLPRGNLYLTSEATAQTG